MKALRQHLFFEFRSGWRNRSLLLLYYLFPMAFYVFMGLVMTELAPDFRSFLLPAMVVFAILSAEILGLPNPLVEAREGGVLRSFHIHGISSWSILGVASITSALHSLVVCTLIAFSAPLLFGASTPNSWGAVFVVTVATVLAYAGLGTLIGVISAGPRTTIMWSQLVYMPSFLLGGVMIPSELLPDGLQQIGWLLPSTHAMLAYRTLAYGETMAYHAGYGLLTLLLGACISWLLAGFLFRWDSHRNQPLRYPFLIVGAVLPYAAWLLV